VAALDRPANGPALAIWTRGVHVKTARPCSPSKIWRELQFSPPSLPQQPAPVALDGFEAGTCRPLVTARPVTKGWSKGPSLHG
jgi:hypothetical protein